MAFLTTIRRMMLAATSQSLSRSTHPQVPGEAPRRTRFGGTVACALALVLGTPALILAQVSAAATLRVHAAPQTKDPVTIAVTGPDDVLETRHVTVEPDSMGVLDMLTPGTYDVAVQSPRGSISAQIALEAPWVVVLVVRAPGDVDPNGRIDVVDRYRIGEGADFGGRLLRELPSAGDLWSLIETAAPFVIADRMDTGGLGTGRSALVGSRGESWALTTVNLDGMTVRLPTSTGLLPLVADMNAAAAVTANSGLAPIEVGTPGVTIDIVPRSPGPVWRGGVDASFTAPRMVGTNALPHAPSLGRVESWRNIGVYGGGPVAEGTGVFLSASATSLRHFERDVPPAFSAGSSSVFARLVSRPTERDHVRAMVAFERAHHLFDGRRQFRDPGVDSQNRFGRAQVVWDSVADSGMRRTVAIGVQRGSWTPDVEAGVLGGTMDRVLHGVVPDPAADARQTHIDGRFEWGMPLQRWGRASHDVRLGVMLQRASVSEQDIVRPIVAESVVGLPARVWVPTESLADSRRTVHDVTLFVGDRVAFGPNMTVDLGLRADMVRGSTEGAETGIRWNTLAPRMSFRWNQSKTAIFGGVGRYTGGHALSFLTFGDPGRATWDVRRWNDGNANGIFDAGEAGVLVARAGRGPDVGSLDPDLRVPTSTEWTVGMEWRPASHSRLRGALMVRQQRNLVGVVNTGVSASSYRVFHVPDVGGNEGDPSDDQMLPIFERLPASFGNDALMLTNPEADPIVHQGIEITYDFATERWLMLFGATAYQTHGWGGALGHSPFENDQLVLGDRFWNPNATKDEYGRLFFDRAYVGKWAIAYRISDDLRIATAIRYQDGQPFTRYVVAPDLAGGPEIVHAYKMGRTRFTYTATVDARVEKSFAFGNRRAALRLDIFNLTNHKNELEEDVVTGPTFRLSTIVQPPITLRLGLRLEF